MVKIKKITRGYLEGNWAIIVGTDHHGHATSKVGAQREAVDKINSIIRELEADRKRFTDEILEAPQPK